MTRQTVTAGPHLYFLATIVEIRPRHEGSEQIKSLSEKSALDKLCTAGVNFVNPCKFYFQSQSFFNLFISVFHFVLIFFYFITFVSFCRNHHDTADDERLSRKLKRKMMAMRTNRWGQRSSTLPSGSLSLSCVLSLIFTLSRAVSLTLLVCVGVSLSVCLVLSQSVLEQHCTIAFKMLSDVAISEC